jgi:hypothetical protein
MANSQIGRNVVVRVVLAGRHISLRQDRGNIVTKLLRENETLPLIPILEFAMDSLKRNEDVLDCKKQRIL